MFEPLWGILAATPALVQMGHIWPDAFNTTSNNVHSRCVASMVAMSIFPIVVITLNTRFTTVESGSVWPWFGGRGTTVIFDSGKTEV
jgi:hypothetical protein